MEKNGNKKRNRGRSLVILGVIFAEILLLGGIIKLIVPDKAYSETEQRTLMKRPELTLASITDGSFMKKTETWMADQFPARSMWVKLASGLDFLTGVREEQDTVLGKDGYLFEKFNASSAADETLDDLVQFMGETGLPGEIMIVPDALGTAESRENLKKRIPSGFPTDPENEWILRAEARVTEAAEETSPNGVEIRFINATDALASAWEQGEQVYYRTDHHWTTGGAYRAFQVWKNAVFPDEPELFYTPVEVCDTFKGTLASRLPYVTSKDRVELYLSDESPKVIVSYKEEQKKTTTLYSETGLTGGNPYEVFFGGNYAMVKIETTANTNKKLLLIKDSYANCFVNFLTPYFGEITVIDPRYYNGNLRELTETERFDFMLVLYNANTFHSNTSLKMVLETALKGGNDE